MKTEDALKHVAHALMSRAIQNNTTGRGGNRRLAEVQEEISKALVDVASLLSVEERV